MKAVVLAAGFATRLYPLTLERPKPLLPVGGRPLLDHILERLEEVPGLDRVVVVTNAKFEPHFREWKEKLSFGPAVTVVSDGTWTNETRLGAIRDLKLAVTEARIADDLLAVAGDNLFFFSLGDFTRWSKGCGGIAIGAVPIASRELARQYGILELAEGNRILRFLEKPQDPPSLLASMGLYFFPQAKIGRMDEYLASRTNPDAPGFFIQWLLEREPLYAYPFEGTWFDIGDQKSYEQADAYLKKRDSLKKAGGR